VESSNSLGFDLEALLIATREVEREYGIRHYRNCDEDKVDDIIVQEFFDYFDGVTKSEPSVDNKQSSEDVKCDSPVLSECRPCVPLECLHEKDIKRHYVNVSPNSENDEEPQFGIVQKDYDIVPPVRNFRYDSDIEHCSDSPRTAFLNILEWSGVDESTCLKYSTMSPDTVPGRDKDYLRTLYVCEMAYIPIFASLKMPIFNRWGYPWRRNHRIRVVSPISHADCYNNIVINAVQLFESVNLLKYYKNKDIVDIFRSSLDLETKYARMWYHKGVVVRYDSSCDSPIVNAYGVRPYNYYLQNYITYFVGVNGVRTWTQRITKDEIFAQILMQDFGSYIPEFWKNFYVSSRSDITLKKRDIPADIIGHFSFSILQSRFDSRSRIRYLPYNHAIQWMMWHNEYLDNSIPINIIDQVDEDLVAPQIVNFSAAQGSRVLSKFFDDICSEFSISGKVDFELNFFRTKLASQLLDRGYHFCWSGGQDRRNCRSSYSNFCYFVAVVFRYDRIVCFRMLRKLFVPCINTWFGRTAAFVLPKCVIKSGVPTKEINEISPPDPTPKTYFVSYNDTVD
jgi:hypothetical protein